MSREMKHSGIPWMGKIPSNWRIGKVKHFYRFITGFTPDSKNESFYDENGIPWVTISDMDGKYVVGTKNGISPNYVSAKNPTLVPSNSLLYSFKLSVGQVARTTFDVYTNEAIASFLPLDNISLDYLFYSSQVCIIENANENIYGAKLLNQDLINNATILFPPLEEQQKIASFLDRKCSEIDEMIALQEKIVEELKAYKQSVITEAVTKGLNPDVPMKDSGTDWIGEIPEHWKMCRVKDILEAGKDGIKIGPFGSSLTNKVNGDGECKIYGQWNIVNKDFTAGKNFVSAETYKELDAYKIVAGDILVSMMGTIGKCAIIPNGLQDGIMDSHVIKIRINKNFINPEFFELMYDKDNSTFIFEQLSRMKKGSIMDGLNSSIIKRLNLLLPPIDEQQEIVSYLLEKRSKIESLISIKLSKIDSLKEYKKSIIYEYVTGKKEVIE